MEKGVDVALVKIQAGGIANGPFPIPLLQAAGFGDQLPPQVHHTVQVELSNQIHNAAAAQAARFPASQHRQVEPPLLQADVAHCPFHRPHAGFHHAAFQCRACRTGSCHEKLPVSHHQLAVGANVQKDANLRFLG